jgi:hypothetical protein
MPRLRVLAGPSPDALQPIMPNNPSTPFKLRSDVFDGEIAVYIKDIIDERGNRSTCDEYFESGRNQGSGRTWSIQARGSSRSIMLVAFSDMQLYDRLAGSELYPSILRQEGT